MESLKSLLKRGTEILEKSKIEEAGLDAWLLLEYATGKNRAYYFAHSEEAVEENLVQTYKTLCENRGKRIPLQHLTHQAFFMGYEFYVNDQVLIPRQDTECVVEQALELLKPMKAPRILDMCTGSGCILLSLLCEREDASGVGADVSRGALKVAERNAESLKVAERLKLIQSDLFSDVFFQETCGAGRETYDMIISNPPYIPTADIRELMDEVRFHDPFLALDGKEDGLFFYRRITEDGTAFLKPGGWLIYEIGCDQGEAVSEFMKDRGFLEVSVKKDLCGLPRMVFGRMPVSR